jgi:DNA-binding NarL/FixJ family response regulator
VIEVLLVDDLPLLRAGFRMVLDAQADIRVIDEAPDGAAAVDAAARLAPDVVLMDVRMPRLDGIEATRQIVAASREDGPRVLILTTFDLDEYVYAGLRAGASGFLLKDVPPAELIAAVRAVARGDAVVAPSLTRRLLDAYVHRLPAGVPPAAADDGGHAALAPLTPRERDVFAEIAAGRSNAEIAERLVLSEATVKTHVGRIFHKLDLRDRVHAVILAYEIGLVGR